MLARSIPTLAAAAQPAAHAARLRHAAPARRARARATAHTVARRLAAGGIAGCRPSTLRRLQPACNPTRLACHPTHPQPLAPDLPPPAPDLPPPAPDLPPLAPDLPSLAPDLPPLAPDLPPLAPDLPPRVPRCSAASSSTRRACGSSTQCSPIAAPRCALPCSPPRCRAGARASPPPAARSSPPTSSMTRSSRSDRSASPCYCPRHPAPPRSPPSHAGCRRPLAWLECPWLAAVRVGYPHCSRGPLACSEAAVCEPVRSAVAAWMPTQERRRRLDANARLLYSLHSGVYPPPLIPTAFEHPGLLPRSCSSVDTPRSASHCSFYSRSLAGSAVPASTRLIAACAGPSRVARSSGGSAGTSCACAGCRACKAAGGERSGCRPKTRCSCVNPLGVAATHV